MRVVFSDLAKTHLDKIADYIAEDNPAAALAVVEYIERAVTQLEDHPLSGRDGSIEGSRELIVSRYPYIVVYQVGDNVVEISGVFHTAMARK